MWLIGRVLIMCVPLSGKALRSSVLPCQLLLQGRNRCQIRSPCAIGLYGEEQSCRGLCPYALPISSLWRLGRCTAILLGSLNKHPMLWIDKGTSNLLNHSWNCHWPCWVAEQVSFPFWNDFSSLFACNTFKLITWSSDLRAMALLGFAFLQTCAC